jgi:DNA-binding transcriptional ArsR family regulator
MMPGDHDHPVDQERVTAARAAVLSAGDAGRLAGLLGILADPVRSRILFALSAAAELCVGDLALALDVTEDLVCYRLSDGCPHPLLEHCLRELLTIAAQEEDR